jgi:hypothetical protein
METDKVKNEAGTKSNEGGPRGLFALLVTIAVANGNVSSVPPFLSRHSSGCIPGSVLPKLKTTGFYDRRNNENQRRA